MSFRITPKKASVFLYILVVFDLLELFYAYPSHLYPGSGFWLALTALAFKLAILAIMVLRKGPIVPLLYIWGLFGIWSSIKGFYKALVSDLPVFGIDWTVELVVESLFLCVALLILVVANNCVRIEPNKPSHTDTCRDAGAG